MVDMIGRRQWQRSRCWLRHHHWIHSNSNRGDRSFHVVYREFVIKPKSALQENFRKLYRERLLEDRTISIKVPQNPQQPFGHAMEPGLAVQVRHLHASGDGGQLKRDRAARHSDRCLLQFSICPVAAHEVDDRRLVYLRC